MAGIGLALALIVLGFTAWDAVLGDCAPASIKVRLIGLPHTPYGFIADVEALNHGDKAASQVIISGAVGNDTAEAKFDYGPEHSSVRGGLALEENPQAGGLKLGTKSYVDVS